MSRGEELSYKQKECQKQVLQLLNISGDTSLSVEEKEITRKLLNLLQYTAEFYILEHCMEGNDVIRSAMASIQTMLNMIDAQLEKDPTNESLLRTKEEFLHAKSCIENRQFDFYVKAMNKKLETRYELERACYGVLSSGKQDFTHMFGDDIVREDNNIGEQGINMMFSILNNEQLKEELHTYLNYEHRFNIMHKGKSESEMFIEYLRIARDNQDLLRRYINCRTATSYTTNDRYIKNKELLGYYTLELENVPKDGILGIVNRNRRIELETSIDRCKKAIAIYDDKMREKQEIEQQLIDLGLGPVIKCYNNIIEGEGLSVEEKAVVYLRANLRKDKLDLTSVEARIGRSINNYQERINTEEQILQGYRSKLSPYAQELLAVYHDDILRLFELEQSKEVGGVTPLLCAYILKTISDTKNLSAEEVIVMCDELKIDEEKLETSYRAMLGNQGRNIQNILSNIVEEEGVFAFEEEVEGPKVGK